MASKITYEAELKSRVFIRGIDIMTQLGLSEMKVGKLNINANPDGSLMVHYKDGDTNVLTEVQ